MTYEATKILEQNIQRGTGGRAATGCPAAGKTGTTDLNTDAWFAGFTPRLSTAVWVGYPNDRTQMTGLFFGGNVDGGTYPAAIWGAYMRSIIGGFCGSFPLPKEPFTSSPFFGEYASTGGGRLGRGLGDGEDDSTDTPDFAPEPVDPPSGDPSGGTEFDPEQYESPPQDAPGTQDPDG